VLDKLITYYFGGIRITIVTAKTVDCKSWKSVKIFNKLTNKNFLYQSLPINVGWKAILQRYVQYYTHVKLLQSSILLLCFGFALGFCLVCCYDDTLIRCYIYSVTLLRRHGFNYAKLSKKRGRDMYKRNIVTLLRRMLRFELHPNSCQV